MTHKSFGFTRRLLNILFANYYFGRVFFVKSNTKRIALCRFRRTRSMSICALIFLPLLAAAPGLIYAKGGSIEVPENSTAKSYGGGWNCDKGYRESSGACVAVKVPANAYPTNKSFGRGWECNRGYQQINESCGPIKVLVNGYLDYSGDKWKCNRGFLMVDKTCVAIKVPANGYLNESSSRPGWKCERGYRADKEACVALKIPENAHINYSGNNWDCNRPFRKRQGRCELP